MALVTGAGRGLGRAFVQELAGRGARAIYAAARDPSTVTGPGIPVALDITDPAQVAGVARDCADVTLLVNNAGVMTLSPLIGAPTMAGAVAGDRHQLPGHAGHVPRVRVRCWRPTAAARSSTCCRW